MQKTFSSELRFIVYDFLKFYSFMKLFKLTVLTEKEYDVIIAWG